ncbi:hypothetical protein TEA_003599 [Camellia sinensis var. sinensis]|uniref:HMA domain-containing protein n=1 Tax=Camellia sinensis var. sinensis TaxID=542762 RepID=A0A4S4D420_CAMSN|nr:hypothetical protein TEA_003599 [Camellia sinensis var. sinensis]
MHPSAPPYNDHHHNYAPPSPFPYFAASPNHSHGPNPNPLYSTTEYGYPNPYNHHLGPGSSLPPIYIGSCHVNINVGEPLVAERYDNGGDSSGGNGKSRPKLDLDGCQQLDSGMSYDDHSGYDSRIESIAVDMKENKLTVIGDVDLVTLVKKLRKLCHTETVSVGPAKELEKKNGKPKKDEGKKFEEPKKDGGRRKDEEEGKKIAELVSAYNPQIAQYYYVDNKEENPEGCVIC